MEALYKKLYDKYTKLKTEKFSELDKIDKDQEEKFINYMSAAEELILHLKNENERLLLQVNDLRSEVASIRSTNDEKYAEYQKLLMEENQKNKALSEEVAKLQQLQHEGNIGSYIIAKNDNAQHYTPGDVNADSDELSNSFRRRSSRKCSRHATSEKELLVTVSCSGRDDSVLRQSPNKLAKETSSDRTTGAQQLECCRRTIDLSGGKIKESGPPNCLYQSLVQYFLGMELSASSQTEEICISAVHKSSGYSFSLTWVDEVAGEAELIYRVLSLGTFERVAPEWMKEVIMFSISMCPIFFERVKQVLKMNH